MRSALIFNQLFPCYYRGMTTIALKNTLPVKIRLLAFALTVVLISALVFGLQYLTGYTLRHIQLDSIGHIIGFFLLTAIFIAILNIKLYLTITCLLCYGALSELGQYYLGFRNGEVRDTLADFIGIGLFLLCYFCYKAIEKRVVYYASKPLRT